MAPKRMGWHELRPESRARYLRAGIDESRYNDQAQLQPGRGKKPDNKKPVRPRQTVRARPTDTRGGRA